MMNSKSLYKDSVIEVKLLANDIDPSLKNIALKYVKPGGYKDKEGNEIIETNVMGGETEWFILPHTFSAVIGKKLFEQYHAGLFGFDENEIKVLKDWLIDMDVIDNAMCY